MASGIANPVLGTQAGGIVEYLIRGLQQSYRIGSEQFTVLRFDLLVAITKRLYQSLNRKDGAAHDGEIAILCFLPHRL